MNNEDGGPAFPGDQVSLAMPAEIAAQLGQTIHEFRTKNAGMTLRQYAAIHLRVPNSGIEWLDEMIREAEKQAAEFLAVQQRGTQSNMAFMDAILKRLTTQPATPDYMDGQWHDWKGGKCPVPKGALVQTHFRNSPSPSHEYIAAGGMDWRHLADKDTVGVDIIRFRVVKP